MVRQRLGLEHPREDFVRAVRYSFGSVPRSISAVLLSLVTYGIVTLAVFPAYSTQMVGAGITYLDNALILLSSYTVETVGWVGMGLTVAYAVFTGIAVTNIVSQLQINGIAGFKGVTGVAPGILAAGCASCGAGILGLLGFTGALTLLPFGGNLLRLVGVLLLLYFLIRTGDPQVCEIDVPGK